ncbi:MAG: hypothetical protein LKE33_04940 [Acidaminococcus sp.]|nr:hypothetical protein [Acidaminococcus sp.]MCI2100025.1 hypothetical protein [Acidaminococcus sp.]MCI2114295.1 hypothetical protein [Acidaminococcus sp.]MCI2116904.1 hypothetical protein [Acidaminococcus sp.]
MTLQDKDLVTVWPKAALIYFCVFLPLSFILPERIAWENGPIEMTQNMVLLFGVFWNLNTYFRSSSVSRNKIWLFLAGFFLLLFGREISWGRVFLLKEITKRGPVFWSMKSIPHYRFIHRCIGLYMCMDILLLVKSVCWHTALQCVKQSRRVMVLVILAAVLTLLGDKGLLLHSFADETIEEFAELFIYLSLLYFSKLYKALTSTVYIKTAEYSPL